jgi:hypothetical protein
MNGSFDPLPSFSHRNRLPRSSRTSAVTDAAAAATDASDHTKAVVRNAADVA